MIFKKVRMMFQTLWKSFKLLVLTVLPPLSGLRPRRSVRAAMAHEIMFYAITQKEGCVKRFSMPSQTGVTPF